MRDGPGDERIVLLLNLAEPLERLLRENLGRRGLASRSLDTDAIVLGDIHVPIGDPAGEGWIRPRGAMQPLFLSQVAGTLADLDPGASGDVFSACERAAVLHMLRMACGNPLNRGTSGSACAYMVSLPEQWARCARAGLACPQWQVHDGGTLADGWLLVSGLYDRSLRRVDDGEGEDEVRLAVQSPRGAAACCAFAGDVLTLLRPEGDRLVEMHLPDRALDEVAELTAAVRHVFGIDYGELVFSYLGQPVFWSVVPQFSPDILEGPAGDSLAEALADMVSR
ncbi:hypothetical protein [Ciceribacter azotifigens]|uniref:hypothetical protein n=1 Tax=Ciceribacter azotifigens TaxID=2069303 RepID=UPI003A86D572